jgi:acyl-coenzyme A thioesterase PaaI-like protein
MKTLFKPKQLPPASAEGSPVDDSPSHSQTAAKKSPKKMLAEQVFEIATRESSHKSFGRALLEESFVDYEIYHHGKLISFNIKATPSMCSDSMTAAPNSLRVSAMLALFDELSTMALFVFDQTRRPGVSVDLKTEILQPIFEGQSLRVNTIIEKTGKVLAFCGLEVYNEAGVLVARGTHVKFMPMGWLWDLFAGAWLLPIVIFFYSLSRGRKIKTPLDAFFRAKREGQRITSSFNSTAQGLSALYKSLQVMPYQPEDPEEIQLQETMKDSRNGIYSVKVRRDLMNPVKSMHGGAVACSIEEACRQYLETQYPSECTKIMISQLCIQYQAPLKVSIVR